jgi:fucose permease
VLLLAAAVGMLLSLYGPAIPELREHFGVGGAEAALVISAHFTGSLLGIGWWGLERRLGARTWFRAATALMVAGAAAIAFAPVWPVVVAGALVLGVGFGVVVVEINVVFAEGFPDRAAAMLNLLGATFGAGAVLGPLAIAVTGGYQAPFCAAALLAIAAMFLLLDLQPAAAPPPVAAARPPAGLVGGFVALCVLYVAIESGVGGWEATSLLANGAGEAAAANWTAGYWAAITVGRLLAIPLALRLAPPVLAGGALALTAAGLVLAHVPAIAPAAYTLAGLALGPVFPSVLAWLALAAPGARRSTAMVFGAGQIGGVVTPAVIGRLVDASSPAVIPTIVLVVSVACLAATVVLRRTAASVP